MKTGVAALLCAAVLVLVNRIGLTYLHGNGFLAFDTARWKLLDYPVDSYAQNPALYESIGWDGPRSRPEVLREVRK